MTPNWHQNSKQNPNFFNVRLFNSVFVQFSKKKEIAKFDSFVTFERCQVVFVRCKFLYVVRYQQVFVDKTSCFFKGIRKMSKTKSKISICDRFSLFLCFGCFVANLPQNCKTNRNIIQHCFVVRNLSGIMSFTFKTFLGHWMFCRYENSERSTEKNYLTFFYIEKKYFPEIGTDWTKKCRNVCIVWTCWMFL